MSWSGEARAVHQAPSDGVQSERRVGRGRGVRPWNHTDVPRCAGRDRGRNDREHAHRGSSRTRADVGRASRAANGRDEAERGAHLGDGGCAGRPGGGGDGWAVGSSLRRGDGFRDDRRRTPRVRDTTTRLIGVRRRRDASFRVRRERTLQDDARRIVGRGSRSGRRLGVDDARRRRRRRGARRAIDDDDGADENDTRGGGALLRYYETDKRRTDRRRKERVCRFPRDAHRRSGDGVRVSRRGNRASSGPRPRIDAVASRGFVSSSLRGDRVREGDSSRAFSRRRRVESEASSGNLRNRRGGASRARGRPGAGSVRRRVRRLDLRQRGARTRAPGVRRRRLRARARELRVRARGRTLRRRRERERKTRLSRHHHRRIGNRGGARGGPRRRLRALSARARRPRRRARGGENADASGHGFPFPSRGARLGDRTRGGRGFRLRDGFERGAESPRDARDASRVHVRTRSFAFDERRKKRRGNAPSLGNARRRRVSAFTAEILGAPGDLRARRRRARD